MKKFRSEPIRRIEQIETSVKPDIIEKSSSKLVYNASKDDVSEPTAPQEKEGVLQFDTEDAYLRGYLPIHDIISKINAEQLANITKVDFSGNGYITDLAIKCFVEAMGPKNWELVEEIDLTGCIMITDLGLLWLTNIPAKCEKLIIINVSACPNITNAGVAALITRWPLLAVCAVGTSVTHSLKRVITGNSICCYPGVRNITDTSLLILPHPDVKHSLAQILLNGNITVLKRYQYMTAKIDPWNYKIIEMKPDMDLFENIVPYIAPQVIIPVDLSSNIDDIKQHITQSILRVLNKESVNTKIQVKEAAIEACSGDAILDCTKLHLEGNGIISKYQTKADASGFYVSATPFSRTNKKLEIICLETSKDVEIAFGVSGYEMSRQCYYTHTNIKLKAGEKYTYEINTQWYSEYNTKTTSPEFTLNKNQKGNASFNFNGSSSLGCPTQLYPTIELSGKAQSAAKVQIVSQFGRYIPCPEELVDLGRISNAACDQNGVLRKRKANGRAMFFSNVSVGRKHNSVTIRILSVGQKANMTLGIGRQDYPAGDAPGWRSSSVAYHGDDGYLYHEKGQGQSFGDKWKVGDEIQMVVSGFKSEFVESGEDVSVNWFKNGLAVGSTVTFRHNSSEKCVFLIGMHSTGQKLQIMNFFRAQPKKTCYDKITYGSCKNAVVSDEGLTTYMAGCTQYARFVSNTPLSKHLPYFEMTLVGTDEKSHIAVGITQGHQDNYNRMIGWDHGTLALHADNGKVYNASGHGESRKPHLFVPGDVVRCGFDTSKAKFDTEGNLIPNQDLLIYFHLNGTKVLEGIKYFYESDGVFPAFSCHNVGDIIQIHNYTSECVTYTVDKSEEKKTEPSKVLEDGSHFLILGIGNDNKQADEVAKILKPKQLLTSSLMKLGEHMMQLHARIGELNGEEQERLAQYLWLKQCFERFRNSTDRLQYASLDIEFDKVKKVENESLEKLKQTLIEMTERYAVEHVDQYSIENESNIKFITTPVDSIRNSGMRKIENISSNYRKNKGLHKSLSQQSIFFEGIQEAVFFSPSSWMTYMTKFTYKPNVQVGSEVICVKKGTLCWTESQVLNYCNNKTKNDPYDEFIPGLGLYRIPCLRIKNTGPIYLFTNEKYMVMDEDRMAEFISPKEESKDMLVMSKTYSFSYSVPRSLFIYAYHTASKYCRVLLLTKSAAVFQTGAVQTIMYEADGDSLKVESNCYCPRSDIPSAVDDVTEYTANIFFIFTDIVDNVIKGLKLLPFVTEKIPSKVVNLSVGCEHDWVVGNTKNNITVCTLCNQCCDKGTNCPWSGIINDVPHQCKCGTNVNGCRDCGICKRCASELWTLKSRIRPCCDVTMFDQGKGHHSKYALNGQTYDEFNCLSLTTNTPVCLKLEQDTSEATIQIYPGAACEIDTKLDLKEYNLSANVTGAKTFGPGDDLNVRLKALQKEVKEESEEQEDKPAEIKPVYYACISNEMKIWQDTGILCYDSLLTSVPVGQFIGPKPLTPELNRFSMKVLNEGNHRYIAIGLCHQRYRQDRQPGWDLGSIGYHADDGGIFSGAGFARTKIEKYFKGDIIACEFDFDGGICKFYKNNILVFTSEKLKIPPGGFYPAVGYHSVGESVQLLEKEPWELLPGETSSTYPPSFDTAKYSQIFIGPSQVINVFNWRTGKRGWVLLSNRSKESIAYVILNTPTVYGTMKARENVAEYLVFSGNVIPDNIIVKWFTIDTEKEYTADQLKEEYAKRKSFVGSQHSLKTKEIGPSSKKQQNKFKLLTKCSERPSQDTDGYCMEIRVNGGLVASYWLKPGKYCAHIPKLVDNPKAVIFNPKFPTYDYPNFFQRGMVVIADFGGKGKQYNECLVTKVADDGELELEAINEYEDLVGLVTKNVAPSSPMIQLKNVKSEITQIDSTRKDKSEEGEDEVDNLPPELNQSTDKVLKQEQLVANVQGYKFSEGDIALKKRGYIPAPIFLVTKGSQKVLELGIDSQWKEKSLRTKSVCKHIPTRVTVQGVQLVESYQEDETFDRLFDIFHTSICAVYLPAKLDSSNLTSPSAKKMFTDITMHLLCCSVTELDKHHFQSHLLDMEPVLINDTIKAGILYGNVPSGFAYSHLISRMIVLPSYEKLFDGGKPEDFSLEQIEVLLYNLLKIYTSLSLIYLEHGGPLKDNEIASCWSEFDILTLGINNKKVVEMVKEPLSDPGILVVKQPDENLLCKAHLLSEQGDLQKIYNEPAMDFKDYDPYFRTVDIYHRNQMKIPSVPTDFWSNFQNLKIFSLSECAEITTIGEGLAKCPSLIKMKLTDLNSLKALPQDIFLSPTLENLFIKNVYVETLPTDVLESSNLKVLELIQMGLKGIPEQIGNLSKLEKLNLKNNPLKELPVSIGHLRNLKYLKVDAMPLLVYETGIQHNQLQKWFKGPASCYTYYLGQEIIDGLFDKFDLNHSGTLDIDEVAHLNNYLFWAVPRLGSDNINNEVYGGVPPAIFRLLNLEYLSLQQQAITSIPPYICLLTKLHTLDLQSQPLLESLPGGLGHLTNLNTLLLKHCPSLRTPPNEVVQRGFESVQAYLKRLAGGFTECRRTKLMLVGLGGAGKTSLLKAIMSSNHKTEGTKGEEITDGISIQPWTIKTQDDIEVTYSTWDFAGQTLYYNTHQFFLSKRAVYILVWSTRQGFEHAGLGFWLSSISCHAPKTPIFIVGTHCDKVPKADIATDELRKLYPQIVKFYFVSSIEGINIKELKDDMLRITLEQKNMGEKIPQVWLNLEKKFLQARNKTSILEWSTIQQFALEEGIYDEKDIKEAIQFLHELGTVQFFDNDVLRDHVVINPQWIVDVMACVVSVKNSPIQARRGEFCHSDIKTVWKKYPQSLHQWLLQLTEQFDLTFPLPKQDINIVPCLLPHEEPKEAIDTLWPSAEELKKKGRQQSKMVYKFSYLPAGLFNRCQVRLFQFSNGKTIWKRGSMLKKNDHMALIRQINENELEIEVCGPRPANIIFLVHEIIEGLIEESFHGVVYDFLVPCPDCISKEGTLDPCLFESDLVGKARDHKAPFLQCRKYFHTISMAQLEEILPSDGTTDFDAHLQRSIIMMQELNTEMSKDVSILYSAKDMPKSGNSADEVDPSCINDDLQKAGYSCWFNADMDTVGVNELTLALKNCKVVLALVSDNFEKDERCRDLLLYTIDGLTKQYIIAPIGNSLLWQQTDLGMRIGKQEQMIMFKSGSRYNEKIKELKVAVKDKLRGLEKTELVDYPECFLSYCWSNSHDAVAKGTKRTSSSLGHYDPRKIKQHLSDNGINVWLDCEQTTVNKGLYDNISKGLGHSKVVVACVSDEYVNSVNCMMELRFAVLTLELPLVVVVVGTGKEWKRSEIGILQQRSKSSKVYLQQKNDSALDTLVTYVKERMPSAAEKLKQEAQNVKKNVTEIQQKAVKQSTNISYQEERELMQRKFMRHIISFMSRMDQTPMPRLILIDLEKQQKTSNSNKSRNIVDSSFSLMSKLGSRPKTASKSKDVIQVTTGENDIDDIWDEEGLCIKMLCEYEEGWHLCDKSLSFKRSDSNKEELKKMSPYLGRLYALARQSHVNLNCLVSSIGQDFINWIEQESKEHTEFLKGFQTLRSILVEDDSTESIDFQEQLIRCHLPSGKIYWLCDKHQKMPRITKLTNRTGGNTSSFKNLYQEDVLLKEVMEQSELYKKKKAEKNTVQKIDLPEMHEISESLQREFTLVVPEQNFAQNKDENTNADVKTEDTPTNKVSGNKKKSQESKADEKMEKSGNTKSKACVLQ